MTQTKITDKDRRIAELERKLRESNAQQAYVYHFAKLGVLNAIRAKTMGGGIVVQMHHLGGKEVCPPFMIKDGLSPELIEALIKDIQYSYNIAVEFKP